MKKILIIGAAGNIGIPLIQFLLDEGKYEITAFDLKTKKVYKRLKKYNKKINIVYGDTNNKTIIESIVKEHNIVIHLGAINPVIANIHNELALADYNGTINIIDSIKNYNPSCYFIYASSTSIYGPKKSNITIKTKGAPLPNDMFSYYKLKAEKYITNNLKKYTIYRVSYTLNNPFEDNMIYNLKLDTSMETISLEDAAYAFAVSPLFEKKLTGNIYNLAGGKDYYITYKEYLINILKNYGLSFSILNNLLWYEKNYYCHQYKDSEELEKIIHFRNTDINSCFEKITNNKKRLFRIIPRILAYPLIKIIKRKKV